MQPDPSPMPMDDARPADETPAPPGLAVPGAAAAGRRDEAREVYAFIARMGDDLRTPMHGLLGAAEELLRSPLEPGPRDLARSLHADARSLLALVEDVVDYTRLEAGRLDLASVAFDPRALVEDVVDLYAPAAAEKSVEVAGVGPAAPCPLVGDAVRLRQVLVNLVSNAVKFTPRGEVTVAFEVEPAGDGHADLALAVRDTGLGIAPERHEAVFEGFAGPDGDAARRFGGTGLGLAICRRLVRLMGGALTLRSAAGEGAEFRAALRLRRAPAVERHGPPLPAGARVLVADAAPAACAALARALGSWGFRVAEARTAAAVEAALGSDGTDPFRLVVVGGTLGDGDGVAFARRLQSRPAPVPLLLALPPDGAAAALRAEGAFLVVSKPVRARALEAAITRVAGACPAWPARTPAAARGPVALGLRVLVVEDNPVNRKVTVRMLEGAGCTAEVACDGDEGVRAFERGGWDAILMDCQMPNLDGFDATREIRRREAATGARRTPVIAVTANVRSGDRERCLAAGMDDHVPKPVRSGELVAALARWTERSRA